ncbi:MAG: bifunctional DNA-formamidopyrimidine glycosylase/DNA-(apurinic or apyrimidinic site) lyase [Rhodanobacteraceae bacterium]|nr:bifunctional DNA-formamidopyrimidine glycosylase/DNA-(apurinic or apyrimidinic site) lyase [Rhodanobacteraceae bacterium]MBL0039871.1 bifunctional DNA-formamidopyrimidine glycosylase/DNA-(apurinic or apyrimidinic site) lyase [Xanthomonadales bacterium]MBP6077713.1 bifunctional DNA-formamidopyrimidine glycosylase/DNA-(apurinic or apyrimidinic site) lyase [Xanthomonadales bacterium]MBP7623457.1 bifunctional DNA-formamidopyrimidine glycosylase/DNA-(apurinic or apyrimidinic site) lyase [Xanthomon
MPELPEVETTRRGIAPHVEGRIVTRAVLRRPDLRWPIPREIAQVFAGQRVTGTERRAKYLLLHSDPGAAIIHLGMSGSLRVLDADVPVRAHDHVDLVLDDGRLLRFNDPRRFGCLLWQPAGHTHELLRELGPEPLGDAFDGDYLFALSRGRTAPVKAFLMDQRVVVGVGNIYVAEALFAAGVRPMRAAGKITRREYALLADAIRRILAYAIERGGTTLRDFLKPDGEPGYFEQELFVYGRDGEPCKRCGTIITLRRDAQRASFYCRVCQR